MELEHGDKSIQSFKCATGVERGQSSEVEGSLSARKMGDFKNEISSGGNNYELPPASTLALTSVGHDGQYYIVETSHQLEEHGGEDMTCSIDPATGNLILHQGNSNGEDNPSTFGDSEFEYRRNESLTLSELGHDYSQYSVTAEEPDLYQSMTLSSETGNLVEEYQAEEEEEEQMSEIKVSNVTSVAHMVGGSSNSGHLGSSIPLKVLLWSNRKTADLIQCIHSHEHKFKIASKTRTHIWNEISKDMAELGHVDCNRDECNKKWSNLYRTWKKVRSRPRETRRRWQNYDAVSELVKSLAVRNRNKVTSSKKHCTKSSKELVEKLMKDNLAHQEAIKLAEEKFAKKAEKLNLERDSMLKEIKQKLDLAHSKYGSSSKMGSQLNNIMNFRTVGEYNREDTGSGQVADNLATITLQQSSTNGSSGPIYFLHLPKDFGDCNQQFQLVEIDSSCAASEGLANNDTLELCPPSSSTSVSLRSQVSDTSSFT